MERHIRDTKLREKMDEKILVADDEIEIADLVELYLKNEGFQVQKCYDGTEALRAVAQELFDLAVLDIMLPGASGEYVLAWRFAVGFGRSITIPSLCSLPGTGRWIRSTD